jgi:hypothetical protein
VKSTRVRFPQAKDYWFCFETLGSALESECARPRAQPCEPSERTRKFHTTQPASVAAPGDGRTPSSVGTVLKRIFKQTLSLPRYFRIGPVCLGAIPSAARASGPKYEFVDSGDFDINGFWFIRLLQCAAAPEFLAIADD